MSIDILRYQTRPLTKNELSLHLPVGSIGWFEVAATSKTLVKATIVLFQIINIILIIGANLPETMQNITIVDAETEMIAKHFSFTDILQMLSWLQMPWRKVLKLLYTVKSSFQQRLFYFM